LVIGFQFGAIDLDQNGADAFDARDDQHLAQGDFAIP
jgi:hypothetical protein